MKTNPWTRSLATAGVIRLAGIIQAEEAQHPVLTAVSSTIVSGYVSSSAIWKLGTGNTLVGRSFDGTDKQDGFNLDVVRLSLAKPLSEGEWSAGYNADLLLGPDAATFNTVTAGPIGTPSNLAIEQANVVMRAPLGNGLNLTFGVFDTPYGYEVTDATRNPDFSQSYGYSIIPRQHTGIVAAYPVTDWFMMAGGVANTCKGAINGRPLDGRIGATNGGHSASEARRGRGVHCRNLHGRLFALGERHHPGGVSLGPRLNGTARSRGTLWRWRHGWGQQCPLVGFECNL
jgi:hypothetical protein